MVGRRAERYALDQPDEGTYDAPAQSFVELLLRQVHLADGTQLANVR